MKKLLYALLAVAYLSQSSLNYTMQHTDLTNEELLESPTAANLAEFKLNRKQQLLDEIATVLEINPEELLWKEAIKTGGHFLEIIPIVELARSLNILPELSQSDYELLTKKNEKLEAIINKQLEKNK